MILYRVFPWDPGAADDQPGGALFTPPSAYGRFDNPDLYRGLYCARTPAAAVGERFGFLTQWRAATFRQHGSRLALATIETDDVPLSDLNLVDTLMSLRVRRVTEVATRDRSLTQPLAARIFKSGKVGGLAWWSVYFAGWQNVMLWDHTHVRLQTPPELLSTAHPAVIDAATTLPRMLIL